MSCQGHSRKISRASTCVESKVFFAMTNNSRDRFSDFVHRIAMNPKTLLLLALFGASVGNNLNAAEHGWVLVANKGDHTLGIIDPEAGRQIAAIPEDGVTGHEVVASQDGKLAFVPIYGNSGVGSPGTDGSLLRVIDLAKREIVGTV